LTSRDQPELPDWIEHIVPKYMQDGKMPGFSIAVVKEGETLYSQGFGARDPKRNLPATPDTLYGIGSITKSFVAIGIMQLVEQGQLSVDDPVKEHIPFKLGLPGNPIRVHHLLTHSLGLPSLASSSVALYRGVGADTGIPWGSAEDFYRLVNGAQDELVAPPGERFFYHNAAWRMLGHVIQEKSGMPFHRYIKEKILEPLGMTRSTLDTAEFYADPDHIVPHWKKPDGSVEPSRFPYPNPDDNPGFSFIAAAGGIASSVNEMAKYLNVQIEKGVYPGGRLASSESVIMMGNSASLPYEDIAEGVFAVLLERDPYEAIPRLAVKQRMARLTGTYEIYKGIESVRVVKRAGMLYLESKTPFAETLQPLIPEDTSLESTMFYTLMDGDKSPVEFVVHEDGHVDLFVERYCFHRAAC